MYESSPSTVISMGPKNRLQAAKMFGLLLRRAIDSARGYGLTHPFAVEARRRVIAQALQTVAEYGELQLELNARALLHEDAAIDEARSHAESLTLVLFREGVRRVTLLPTVTAEELAFFLDAWIAAVLDPLQAEGVTTRLWENEPKGLAVVVIDTFEIGQDAEVGDERVLPRAAATLRDEIDAIVSAIADESPGGVRDALPSGLVSISADDAALLRSDMVRAITAEQLASQDVQGAPQLAALTGEETRALAAELSDGREAPLPRFLAALVNAGVLGGEREADAALATFERLALSLAEQHSFEAPFVLFTGLVDAVPKDTTLGALRVALLKRFRGVLTSAAFVERLMAGLDTAETAGPAIAALKYVGRGGAQLVRERVSQLKTPEGRERAAAFAASFDLGSSPGAADARPMEPAVMIGLLHNLGTLKEAEADQLVERALQSPDASVRRAAVAQLSAERAVRLPNKVLIGRLGDPDAEVRRPLIELVTTLENPTAVPTLVSSLRRPIELAERLAIYRALGAIGGDKARDALLAELASDAPPEARVACAEALGRFRGAQVVATLEGLASKVLLNSKVRAACREALAKIKAHG